MTLNEWYKDYSNLSAIDILLIKQHISKFKRKPLISLLTPVYNTKEIWLRICFESMKTQLYDNWEWCICDNASDPETSAIIQEYASKDPRIKVVRLEVNQGGFGGTNAALDIATGEFIGFLDSDDEMTLPALYLVAEKILAEPDATVIYTDELMILGKEECTGAFFKPEFSPHLMQSELPISHLSLWKKDLLKQLRLRESAGSHDYDLTLRTMEIVPWNTIKHIPYLCYKYRTHPNSTSSKTYSYCVQGAIKALKEHLDRLGRKANVYYDWPWYRVQYELDTWPHVDILIASINKNGILGKFLELLLSRTDYPDYSIYLCVTDDIKEKFATQFAVFVDSGKLNFVPRKADAEFNYSVLANALNKAAKGPLICYLNDDLEPLNFNWLKEMVPMAMHAETGIVGGKLLYPDLTYQHVGCVLGIGQTVAHTFKGKPDGFHGYFGRAKLVGNSSVVTGACWVLRKELYDQMGGYDEEFRVAYGDADLCLRILKAGYYNVYTPYASFIHRESTSRGRNDTKEKQALELHEHVLFRDRYGDFLNNDPFYNPNLALNSIEFAVALAKDSRYKKPWLTH